MVTRDCSGSAWHHRHVFFCQWIFILATRISVALAETELHQSFHNCVFILDSYRCHKLCFLFKGLLKTSRTSFTMEFLRATFISSELLFCVFRFTSSCIL